MKANNQIAALLEERDKLQADKTNSEIEIKKLEGKIAGFHKKKKEAANLIKHLEKEHKWIQSEKE